MTAPADLLERYRRAGRKIVTAESCTGGMVAAALTDIAGSSDVVERGLVTYSNAAKIDMLGVPAALLAKHGAVSLQVARAMAEGARARSHPEVAVAIHGGRQAGRARLFRPRRQGRRDPGRATPVLGRSRDGAPRRRRDRARSARRGVVSPCAGLPDSGRPRHHR
jgi:hypothetical protein